ncbi:hypothetical protein MMC28_008488 [Mycoblastus sanguinarius]|nr:hypothetical protein [Mycoblastus sanguinarius]
MREDQPMQNDNAMELGEVGKAEADKAEVGTKTDNPTGNGEGKSKSDPSNGDGDGTFQSAPQESIESVEYISTLLRFVLVHNPVVFDFKLMAQVNILHLQNEIGKMHADAVVDKIFVERGPALDLRRLEDILHRYCKFCFQNRGSREALIVSHAATAIRDYEYMTEKEDTEISQAYLENLCEAFPSAYKKSGPLSNYGLGPFLSAKLPGRCITGDPLRSWLKKTLPKTLTWTIVEIPRRVFDFRSGKPPDTVSPFVDKLARFIVAITGGLSLVVPMLVMRLHENSNKSLITTSVAVVLFAGMVSVVFKASNAETLGITAAYAAVLVVFVGTSS